MEQKKYNVSDVMKKLGLAKTTILRWEKDGKIPQAERDRMGWRYWNENAFQNIATLANTRAEESIIKKPLVTLISSAGLDIPAPHVHAVLSAYPEFLFNAPMPAILTLAEPELTFEFPKAENEAPVQVERFLPKLSKENKFISESPKPEYADGKIFEIKFTAAAVLTALTFFASSSIATSFAHGFEDAWLGFESGFNYATSRTVESAGFVASSLSAVNNSGINFDEKYFAYFNGESVRLNKLGYDIKKFYSDGGEGLYEGVSSLLRIAKINFKDFSENIVIMQDSGNKNGEKLALSAEEARTFLSIYSRDMNEKLSYVLTGLFEAPLFVSDMLPDLMDQAATVEISLNNFYAPRLSIFNELKADWKFLSSDIKKLPSSILEFHLSTIKDGLYAARDLFIAGSSLALNTAESGTEYFSDLGHQLASPTNTSELSMANSHVVLRFLIGK